MADFPRKTVIGIVAPACAINQELADRVRALVATCYPATACELRFHDQCFLRWGHFAGTDEQRSQAFLDVANNPRIDAVWFARGGYGSFRLLDRIVPALTETALAKTYLGYSDLGSLLAGLYGAGCRGAAHGPMPSDINRDGGDKAVRRALSYLVENNLDGMEPSIRGEQPLAAFNITILAHLMGTPWQPDLGGHVLMLEDVDEPLYRIDRCMGTILSAPLAGKLAGVKLGRISKIVPNDPDFGRNLEEIVEFWCARARVPYLGRADIGHDIDNKIVPFGRRTDI